MLIMAREGLEAIEHHSQSPSSTIRMEIVSSTPPLASISWDRYSVSSQTLDAFDLDTSQLIHSELDDDDDSKPRGLNLFDVSNCHAVVVGYSACLELCVAKSPCKEASVFIKNDFALLRSSLIALPPLPKELLRIVTVRVAGVRMASDDPCTVQLDKQLSSTLQSKLSSCWRAVKTRLCTSPSSNQDDYLCLVRPKSLAEGDAVIMFAGSTQTSTVLLDSLEDDLILQVQDLEGNYQGQVVVRVAAISEDPDKKLCWWPIYREPELEVVGKIQLDISYTTSLSDIPKYGFVYKTLAYDVALDCAMKAQHFQQRNLLLQGIWKWLISEFVSHYEISEAYSNLRYLSRIMDVATPTADCISLVYDLLLPVMDGRSQNTLSRQENQLLGEIEEKIKHILALVFENYKSLDEQSPSGIMEIFMPAPRMVAPVLKHAVKLYALTHDISSPEAQDKLYNHFQAAVVKRSRHHLTETNVYARQNFYIYPDAVACEKMKSLCLNIRNDILADIEIHNCNILPSFIDLPNLSSRIYNADLLRRFGAFVAACPPTAPSSHVTDVMITIADVVKVVGCRKGSCQLKSWNIE